MSTARSLLAASVASFSIAAATVAVGAPGSPSDAAALLSAKTPAEHEATAKAFEEEAAALEKKATSHADLAKAYGAPGLKPAQTAMARHCMALEKEYHAAAKENLALADLEHKLAKATSK